MWLINSSIGRKVVMSVTGVALILFLTFHMSMNLVALFSAEGYNMICEFLGANWYAVVATAGLGLLVVLHLVFAFWLTMQNRKARGPERYAVSGSNKKVEWASKNMLVLGIIVLLGMVLHLWNFWYNMMFAEIFHIEPLLPRAADGYYHIEQTFSCPVFVVLYLVWLAAIWFHLSHGFWSAMQTFGWNGKTWFCRWKVIGIAYTTAMMAGFAIVVIAFALNLAPSQCAEKAACEKAPACAMACPEAANCTQDCADCDKKCADCTQDCATCPKNGTEDCCKVKGNCPKADATAVAAEPTDSNATAAPAEPAAN